MSRICSKTDRRRSTLEVTGTQHTPRSGNLMLGVRVGRPVKPQIFVQLHSPSTFRSTTPKTSDHSSPKAPADMNQTNMRRKTMP